MTTTKSVANIILDSGGTNELTIYTESCEKVYSKKLIGITAPQSTSNWTSGPKDTKIVDLLRIEIRFNVRGTIASTDETKLEALHNIGGIVKMTWKTTDFYINFEKLTITNDGKGEQDETDIMFTGLVGVNI
jgi:hypothetical protein